MMKAGDILKLDIHGLQKTSLDNYSVGDSVVWKKETDILLFFENSSYVLTPREVSGMRLYINSKLDDLVLVQRSKTLINALNEIAKENNCKLLQIQIEDCNYLSKLSHGFFCSNLIMEKELKTVSKKHDQYSLISNPLDKNKVNDYALREYVTRLLIPGGTPIEDDYLVKVEKEYIELSTFDIDDLEFREYTTVELGRDIYFVWLINLKKKEAIRCFSWSEKKLRGKGIPKLLNDQITYSLAEEGIKKAFSFTSLNNISQIKTSLRTDFKLNKLVISREVI
jgi:hypothetical protein